MLKYKSKYKRTAAGSSTHNLKISSSTEKKIKFAYDFYKDRLPDYIVIAFWTENNVSYNN